MWKLWTAFWQLSKSERGGIFVLILLLSLNLTADWWMAEQRQVPVLLSEALAPYLGEEDVERSTIDARAAQEDASAVEPVLFHFDINTIDSTGLIRLGVVPRAISGLMRFRSKGGQVRREEDFDKLFSLSEADKNRLRPWLKLAPELPRQEAAEPPPFVERTPTTWVLVDLNVADSAALVQVRGIGPAFASRIIRYRGRLGGFLRLDQLGEVYGIDSTRYAQLAPFFKIDAPQISKRALNTSSEEDLATHPYIGKRLARQIVAYREQHGDFLAAEQLLRIHGLDSARFVRMKPYLQ